MAWGNCILCEKDIKATPRHVTSEHDISWEKYKEIAEEEGVDVQPEKKDDKDEDDDRRRRITGAKSEEAVTEIALQSFQESMKSMNKEKERLAEEKREAEKEKRQFQKQLIKDRQRSSGDRGRRKTEQDDFLKTLANAYVSDLRQEKKYLREQESAEVRQLRDELKDLKEELKREKGEEARDMGRGRGSGDGGNMNVDITDESVKEIASVGQQLVQMIRQNQILKMAYQSDEFPDANQMLKREVQNISRDVMGQNQPSQPQFEGIEEPRQQPRQEQGDRQKPPQSGGKSLEEILEEE